MIYAITKVRKNFGMLTAGLFCFLLPAMPKLADYTVEVRMYGWALFTSENPEKQPYNHIVQRRMDVPGRYRNKFTTGLVCPP